VVKITRQERRANGDGERLAWSYARTPELSRLLSGSAPVQASELNSVTGLAWCVVQEPLFMFVGGQPSIDDDGIVIATPSDGHFKLVASPTAPRGTVAPDRFLTVRDDTYRPLGIVKRRYRAVQNDEAPLVLDALVAAGRARYEAAGALRGGAQVWWVARLLFPDIAASRGGLETCLLLTNGHDGSVSTTVSVLSVHGGTATTLAWPLPTAARTLTLRHTSSASGEALDAKRVLGLAHSYRTELDCLTARMRETLVTEKQLASFLEALLPTPTASIRDGRVRNQRGITIAENTKSLITLTYLHEEALESVRGTLYGVVLACQYYSDHLTINRTTDEATPDENRFKRLTSEANLGCDAFRHAMELVP
jgi:phage/plasmid-like protein (TIGR03299 family)